MLAAINVGHSPDVRCPTDGGASHCPDPWEIRHMYVIEAKPRPGHFVSLYDHEVLYLDSEAVFVMADDIYDRSGPALHQLHFVDVLLRSLRARCAHRDLSVQARVPGRLVDRSMCRAASPPFATIRRCMRLRAIHGSSTWARSTQLVHAGADGARGRRRSRDLGRLRLQKCHDASLSPSRRAGAFLAGGFPLKRVE